MSDRTEERKLAVKLTAAELREQSKELADTLQEYDNVEAQKKSVTSDLGEQLKNLRKDATELADIVKHGRKFAYVPCTWTDDEVSGVVILTRDDTGEVVETRELPRQQNLLS